MPHSWILDCLDLYKINRTLRAFIRSSMGMCRTALEANLQDLTKKLWTPQAHAASDSSWTVYFTGCQTHSNTFFAAAQPQSFLEVSLTALSLHAHTSSLVLSVTTRREAGTAPWAHSPTPPPQRSQRPDPCHTPPLPDWSRGYIRLNLHPPPPWANSLAITFPVQLCSQDQDALNFTGLGPSSQFSLIRWSTPCGFLLNSNSKG